MGIYRGQFPVMLTFDVDGETLWLNRDPHNAQRPVVMSQGRYGPVVGVPRLLRLLARHGIQATFFVPGWIAEKYPDMLKAIDAGGHEIGHHGYLHEWPTRLTPERELAALRRGIDAIEKVIGRRPVGYRAPGWELSSRTLGLLVEHGFRYSSNLMDADGPYFHAVDGKPARLVELPVEWGLSDSSYYLYGLQLPSPKLTANSAVLEQWVDAFDALATEGGCFVLTMHPQLTGRPHRTALLERFVAHVRETPGTVFARCIDVAEAVMAGSREGTVR